MLAVKNKTFKKIEQYKIVFFGDNKILMLMQKSLDNEYRGYGMFEMDYIDDPEDKNSMLSALDLSLPEGKKLQDGLYIVE